MTAHSSPPDQKKLLLAVVLSVAILVAFHFLVEKPRMMRLKAEQQTLAKMAETGIKTPLTVAVPDVAAEKAVVVPAQRVPFHNEKISGSLSLQGGRFDDVVLSNYYTHVDKKEHVRLLSVGDDTQKPHHVEFGWLAAGNQSTRLPDAQTIWQLDGASARASELVLEPSKPLSLFWDNGQGVIFRKTINVDHDYLFTVDLSVENKTNASVSVAPYGLISRQEIPASLGTFILHEGPLAVIDGVLNNENYNDVKPDAKKELKGAISWLGMTDKYWLSAIIPANGENGDVRYQQGLLGKDRPFYQVDFLGTPRAVEAGQKITYQQKFFIGAKEITLLDKYKKEQGITNFDLAVDFGWFYFLTKPFFYVLYWLSHHLGNLGLAILAFTIILRAAVFPLANRSFKAMSKMKMVAPKLEELKKTHADDKAKMQQEIMALYQREGANPLSGCWPMFLQIPIFFALYKVLLVAIEMRHAPFYGWIQDLSTADPTSIFNLFGLIPWNPPGFLMIGAWPLIMGATLFLQQKLNPPPADPVQRDVMMLMPLLMIFTLSHAPAGLVIYWSWTNILSMLQQAVIMKRMGVEPLS
ncbi:MAG: membrane protein insertase YidC [Alphaproteobacteria bacterium]